MSTEKTIQSRGISTLSLLGVLFVGLKLTGYITWSWWLVTLPFWAGIAIVLVILAGIMVVLGVIGVLYGVVIAIESVVDAHRSSKRRKAILANKGRY